ncbi:MAG TPA: universal stress protein [Chloroflexota bacterium]|nr:universal stress protein [Chloroflexota bacterium]
MPSTILVPLDGSALAEHALPFAERIARAAHARVILNWVVPAYAGAETSVEASVALAARENLEEIASRLRRAEITVAVTVPEGDAAAQTVSAVAALGVDLIVMSTHGRSGIGRWLYGSIADAVIRLANVPVLLVPPHVSLPWPPDGRVRIVVPLDESQLSEAVLGPALEFATRLGAELLLVEVVAWPPRVYSDPVELLGYDLDEQVAAARTYLATVATRLRESGASVHWRIEVGPTPAATIVQLARAEHADLIAMATHGRSGLARVVLGSTTTGALQHAEVPLLIVRPTALQAAQPPAPESYAAPVRT